MAKFDNYFKNFSTLDPVYSGKANGSNHIYLNGTDQSVPYPILNNGGDNSYCSYYDVATKQRVQIAHQGDSDNSSVELVENGTFNDGLNGWEVDSGDSWFDNGDSTISFQGASGEAFFINRFNHNLEDDNYYIAIVDITSMSIGSILPFYTQSLPFDAPLTTAGIFASDAFRGDAGTALGIRGENATDVVLNNYSVKEVLPISTTYDMTVSHSMYMTHNIALTANELAQIDASSNILMDVWFKGTILVDGFAKANIQNFFPGNCG